MTFKIKKLVPNLNTPSRSYDYAAGWDFYAAETISIPSGKYRVVKLGIICEFDNMLRLELRDRSGLARKHGIHVLAGVIDSDYRGELAAILFNLGVEQFDISFNDKIVQGLFSLVPPIVDVIVVDSVGDTVRGTKGFGSTQ